MASCGTIAPPNERPSSVIRLAVGRCPATERAGRVLSVSAIPTTPGASVADRKSTRLNSSHLVISYAVFCLKKKKKKINKKSKTRTRQQTLHHISATDAFYYN